MSMEPRIGPNGREDDLTQSLRRSYAAPTDERYWDGLERRIMERIARAMDVDAWWQPLARWAHVGALAAGVVVLLAGWALWKGHEADEQVAYEALIERPRAVPAQGAGQAGTVRGREATLRYVISP